MAKERPEGEGRKQHVPGGVPHAGHAEEPHEGAPEWLISFADNVTLMMGFFVLMFAMNYKVAQQAGIGQDAGEGSPASVAALDLAIGIRDAFNNPVSISSDDPADLPLVRRLIERGGESEARTDGPRGREHDVKSIRPGRYFSRGASIAFEGGSTVLGAEATQTLEALAGRLRGVKLVITVSGHVSSAESFEKQDRGMRLSYDRAVAVAEYLASKGIGWQQIRVLACGDNDRLVAAAYDLEGHRRNQRVEVTVTDELATLDPSPPEPAKTDPDP